MYNYSVTFNIYGVVAYLFFRCGRSNLTADEVAKKIRTFMDAYIMAQPVTAYSNVEYSPRTVNLSQPPVSNCLHGQ